MPVCERVTWADIADYAAGGLAAPDAGALEEHLFTCGDCGARAAEFERLVRALGSAVRSGAVGGLVTDTVLNRLAREGVRLRTFALSPGDAVPCAVWDDDEVLALRLRADLADVREVTVSQHVAGREVIRVTGTVSGRGDEVIVATPAAVIRELPVVDVEIRLLAGDDETRPPLASYTLQHGGALRR